MIYSKFINKEVRHATLVILFGSSNHDKITFHSNAQIIGADLVKNPRRVFLHVLEDPETELVTREFRLVNNQEPFIFTHNLEYIATFIDDNNEVSNLYLVRK